MPGGDSSRGSAYCTAPLLLKRVLVLGDSFQQRVLARHGLDVLLDLFASLGDLPRKETLRVGYGIESSQQSCAPARQLPTDPLCSQERGTMARNIPPSMGCPQGDMGISPGAGLQPLGSGTWAKLFLCSNRADQVRKLPWGRAPLRFGWKTHHLPLILHFLLQLIQLHLQQLLLCHVLSHFAL